MFISETHWLKVRLAKRLKAASSFAAVPLLAAGLFSSTMSFAQGAGATCSPVLKSEVEAARAATAFIGPAAPLDLRPLKGKTIWYITVTFNQFSSDWVAGLREAANYAGVKLVTYDGQGSASRFNEGISQAVAQKAGGIIIAAIDPAVIAPSLAEARAAGIPVLNGFNSDSTTPLPAGMYGNFTSDFTADGALAAKWAIASTDCKARVVMLTSSAITVWQNMTNGARKAFAQHCPSCSLKVIDVDIANIATNLGSQLQTALQQDPRITHVFAAGDALVPFALPIVATAGSNAKVIGRDGLTASLKMIATKGGQDMTLAMPEFRWLGWLAFDDLARAMLGQPRRNQSIPVRIVDAGNVQDGSTAKLFPAYVGYQSAFEKSWTR